VNERNKTVQVAAVLVEGIDVFRRYDVVAAPLAGTAHLEKRLV